MSGPYFWGAVYVTTSIEKSRTPGPQSVELPPLKPMLLVSSEGAFRAAVSAVVALVLAEIRASTDRLLLLVLPTPPALTLLTPSLATRHIRQEARGRAAIFCCGEATYS